MILFVDTSVLVKLYIAEPGSERMREAAAQEEPIAASLLAFAEIHATFARRHREELLLALELEDLQLRFAEDWEELMQVPVGARDLNAAELFPRWQPSLGHRRPYTSAKAHLFASSRIFTSCRGQSCRIAGSKSAPLDHTRV